MTIEDDPRTANWRRATEGARQALVDGGRRRAAIAERDAKGRMKRAPTPVEIVLRDLRADIAAGVPHKALLDRVDDELFKLRKKP